MIVVLIAALAAAVTVAVAAAAILGRMYQKEKRTVIMLNRQLDLSHKAFVKQRVKLHEQTAENELLKADNEKLKQKTAEFVKGKYYGAEISQTEFVVTRKFESKEEGLAERVGFLRRSLLREMIPLIEDNALFNIEELCDDTYRITARLKLIDFQNAKVFLYDDSVKPQIAERTEPFNDPVQENRKPIPWEAD